MSMSTLPSWKREQKWGDADRAIEEFRIFHAELEQSLDNPERVKEILAKIKQTQDWFDHSMS